MAENQEIKVFFGGNEPFEADTQWNPPESVRKRQFQSAQAEASESKLSASFGFQLIKTGITTVTQRVGSYTGDYIAQNAVNNAMEIVSWAGSIGMAIGGNYIPLIMQAVGTAVKATDYQSNISRGNLQAQLLSQLTGTSASNRSRGTGGKI